MNDTDRYWSRRQFLSLSAVAVGAWSEAAHAGLDRDQARQTYGGYPMGLHGASLSAFDNAAITDMVAGLGLHWLELTTAQIRLAEIRRGSTVTPASSPQEIRELRRLLAAADITPTAFGPIRLAAGQESNRPLFDRASSLGITNLSCIPDVTALDDLEALADEYEIRLAIHNNASGAFDSIAEVRQALNGRGPHVGACLDIGNALRRAENPATAVRTLGSRLIGIHLKDVSARTADSDVIVLGAGFLDVHTFFDAVREVGFPDDGALSLEYLARPNDPLPGLREGLRIAQEAIRS